MLQYRYSVEPLLTPTCQSTNNVMNDLGSNVKLYTRFFLSNTFISNAWLKLAKSQANAKQQPKAEFF